MPGGTLNVRFAGFTDYGTAVDIELGNGRISMPERRVAYGQFASLSATEEAQENEDASEYDSGVDGNREKPLVDYSRAPILVQAQVPERDVRGKGSPASGNAEA
jgi:hypothetical protein